MHTSSIDQKIELYPGKVIRWKEEFPQVFRFDCDNHCSLRLHILGEDLVRFRFSTNGIFEDDFSYAIEDNFVAQMVKVKVVERENYFRIQTPRVAVRLEKQGLFTKILDRKGTVINEDDKGFHWEKDKVGGDIVQMSKRAQHDESYFGLGDKTGHLSLRGQRKHNWVTDSFGYGDHTDPLYRAIPFYYGLHKGNAYGIFFDNSFQTYFDFAKERHDATSFWSHGGEMNYYFFYGPALQQVAERYTDLTGRPELPPLWALGFHQCKWSYYPEAEVRRIANEFRMRNIPCDAIYLDIDYMDEYRCFTWDYEIFPDPTQMINDLKADGFNTVVMIDPGIKFDPDYFVFKEGMQMNAFCRRSDGPLMVGDVWPGPCVWPDYTRPDVRKWWAGLYKDLIRKNNIAGFWNDMNEPAVFKVPSKTFPDDVRHDYDGHPCSHRKAHNVYGMQMSRASLEGIKEYSYPKRPFLITRASYSGGQRFASAWTGDNVASWEHLRIGSVQCQRMSISGFSHIGTDIGGFNGIPDGELFVRWLQLGVFHPLMRVHSIGYNDAGDDEIDEETVAANMARESRDQEPWSYGDAYTPAAKAAIELRYRLLPYLYTAFWQYVKKGTPVLRPLSFLDQHDPETLHRQEEFGFGDNLLVCPISAPGVTGRRLYLPKGIWYEFGGNEPMKGGLEIFAEAALDRIPMFVKAGAVVPIAPVMQHTGEKRIHTLSLHVYYKHGHHESVLYTDAGEGYDHESGQYSLHSFSVNGSPQGLYLSQRVTGNFVPDYQQYKIVLHGLPFSPSECLVDSDITEIRYSDETIEILISRDFRRIDFR
ncbi:MAG: glycoside hydrolase family 31 protein [Bacteroidia bacterium]|nr:glycoside hydrolase family 31 protein [Bacteroidia bacterium]